MAEKKKRLLALLLMLALGCAGCGGEKDAAPETPAATQTPAPVSVSAKGRGVICLEGEEYYPSQDNWRYHFVYSYPLVLGEDYAAAAINDAYQMTLNEVSQLTLPMLADEEDEEKIEVRHDFFVACNNDRVLSIVQKRSQEDADGQKKLVLDAVTFDVAGEYVGSPLSLRGCVLAALTDEKTEEITQEKYPRAARIIAGSSDLIAQAAAEKLYPEFRRLQEAGVCRADVEQEDFEWELDPAFNFYADEEGRIAFFFPPALLTEPSFDVPVFAFTIDEIEQMME